MMSPSYVESNAFRVVASQEFNLEGRSIQTREYVLHANPDQRPSSSALLCALNLWLEAGRPEDGVFHVGPFLRITDLGPEKW